MWGLERMLKVKAIVQRPDGGDLEPSLGLPFMMAQKGHWSTLNACKEV